jgi:PAS domain S-box-containing protein
MRDNLSKAIVGTSVGLAALTLVGLPVFGSIVAFRETQPVVQLPWVLPVAQAFVILSALAIAFLSLGRYLALGTAWAYWAGAVFIANAVLGVFYLLSWPGLIGDRGLIGHLSNTASWFFHITFSCLALLLVVASPRWIGRLVGPPIGVYTTYALVGAGAVAIALFSLVIEDALPLLVVGLVFTPLSVAFVIGLVILLVIAAVTAYRGYQKAQDVMLGYLALFLVIMAFGLLHSVTGGKRYDVWWYAARVLYVSAYLVMLFGLLQEGYALFGRERTRNEERLRLVGEIEQLASVAQRRAAELEATVESIVDAVFVCDAEGNIVRSNAVGMALLGRRPGEALGALADYLRALELRSIDGHPLPVDDLAITRALRHGEVVRGREETGTQPGTGNRIDLYVSAAPLHDEAGAIVGAVEVATDITGLRQLQERQQEFVSLVSHDLRNPLTSVMGMAQLLSRSLARKGLADEVRSTEMIVKSAKRMETMISELVESAQFEAGQAVLRKQPTDLAQVLADLVERVGTPQDRERIHVETPEPVPPVLADKDRIERAITNLLTNALKYSSADKPVVVGLIQRDGNATVCVADQGVGIPQEDLEHVFERYFRSQTVGTRDGLGLGLYITRLIVQAHGGQVWGESEVGRGSTFYLSLPLQDGGEG